MLEQAARKYGGRLVSRAVRGAGDSLVGWYLYDPSPGGVAEVLALVARPRSFADVFDTLVADAVDAGAVALSGRAHPSQLFALSARRCRLACDMWLLLHTRDAEVQQAFLDGEAFFTGLETERWMRFIGDPFDA